MVMDGLDQLFQFIDPFLGVVGIVGIHAVRTEIILRVITPVVVVADTAPGPFPCLVEGFVAVVIGHYRHQLDMGDTERLEVIQFLDKCGEGTEGTVAESRIDGEIPHMHFIDNRVFTFAVTRDTGKTRYGDFVWVDDGSFAGGTIIFRHGSGVGIKGCSAVHQVTVKQAFQLSNTEVDGRDRCTPDPGADVFGQYNGATLFSIGVAGLIELQRYLVCSGSPKFEAGYLVDSIVLDTQVSATVVVILV